MYRTINDSLWSEPWLERLGMGARLLLVNLLTSPRQTPCGVVEIGIGALVYQTGMTAAEVETAYGELERENKIIRWPDRHIVLVRRFFAWQRSNSSPNYTIAARKQLATLPLPVAMAVVKEHPEIGEGWVAPGDMGHTPTEPIPNPSPIPSPTQGDKETATATATATATESTPGAATAEREIASPPREEAPPASGADAPRPVSPRYTVEYEVFWQEYPADGKTDKAGTFAEYKRQRPDHERLMQGLARWQASRKWAEGVIVDAKRWLKERRWDAQPEPAGARQPMTANSRDRPAKPTAADNTEAGLRSMFAKLGVDIDADKPGGNGHADPGGVRGDVLDADYHVAPSGADPRHRGAPVRALPGRTV